MSNSLKIKRAYQQILKDFGYEYVEGAVNTGVKRSVQVQIPGWTEEYNPVQLNSDNCFSNMSLTINLFSESQETMIMEAVSKLISIGPKNSVLKDLGVTTINPSSSFTDYNPESAEGLIQAQIILDISYIFKKGQ